MSDSSSLELQFYSDEQDELGRALSRAVDRFGPRVRVSPWDEHSLEICRTLASQAGRQLELTISADQVGQLPPPSAVKVVAPETPADVVLLTCRDADALSEALLAQRDLSDGCVLAPVTDRHVSKRHVYMISIPKAGTHMLTNLLGSFGLERSLADEALPGRWSFLSRRDAHAPFEPFMSSLAWDSREGRKHPFFVSPVVFIYRNPLDILVSESTYVRRLEMTPFGHYFGAMDTEKVISKLIQGPMGTLSARVMSYAGWLECPNVAPVCFEELVGRAGDGDDNEQLQCIWSLQLKLHVPGSPEEHAQSLFDRKSPTFHKGKIGRHRQILEPQHYQMIELLERNERFMSEYGYRAEHNLMSSRRHEFRARPMRLDRPPSYRRAPDGTPRNHKGFFISCFGDDFLAVRNYIGTEGVVQASDEQFEEMIETDQCLLAPDLESLLAKIDQLPPDLNYLPILVETKRRGYNIVAIGPYCIAMKNTGTKRDLSQMTMEQFEALEREGGCIIGRELQEVRDRVDILTIDANGQPGMIQPDYHGFNIVRARGTCFALKAGMGHVDIAGLTDEQIDNLRRHGLLVVHRDLPETRRLVERLSETGEVQPADDAPTLAEIEQTEMAEDGRSDAAAPRDDSTGQYEPERVELLLINPGGRRDGYQGLADDLAAVEPPIWVALLAENARRAGYRVAVLDAEAEGLGPAEAAARVAELRPRLAAVIVFGANPSASTQKMPAASAVCGAIREAGSDTLVLLGGLHASALPQQTMEQEPVDMVCQGEGPHTLRALLECLRAGSRDFASVPGLWWRRDGEIVGNEPAPLIEDLDNQLPGGAWDLLPMDRYRAHNWHCFDHLQDRGHYAVIYTSLGCPFNCHFCCINALFGKSGIRYRSVEQVVEEIDRLVTDYGVRNIKILDELFVLHRERVEKFCDLMIQTGHDVNFWAYARVDTVDAELLAKLRQAGVRWLAYGFESASAKVRDGVSKGFSDDKVAQAVQWTRDAGIHIIANYIVGLPEDDHETMRQTLDEAIRYNFEYLNIYCAMAYPGSQLYETAVREGWRLPEQWHQYAQLGTETLPLATRHLSAEEVLDFRDRAFVEYHRRPEYLEMMRESFGQEVVDHIRQMLSRKVERKLLQGHTS